MGEASAAFNYEAFIEEVKALIQRAQAFTAADKHSDSPALTQWRHQLHDYIQRIERGGYRINCDDVTRAYYIRSYGSITAPDQLEVFERDLGATLGELQHIVDTFDKYGDPTPERRRGATRPIAAPVEPANLAIPERITMPWIWRNASATLLWTVIVGAIIFIGAVFSFGVFIGGTKAGQQVMGWFKPADAPPAALGASGVADSSRNH
jgi:hypothetical protein